MTKKAITLAELLITLSVIGFIGLLTIPVLNENMAEYSDKIAAIKANTIIHSNIEDLLNNSSYYSSNHNFAYNAISDTEKFQRGFKSLLANYRNDTAQGTPCYRLNGTNIDNAFCTVGIDGIAWGIPYTDFDTINTIKISKNGVLIPYVPITVYVNYDVSSLYEKSSLNNYVVKDSEEALDYFYNNAIIYGVRRDGQVIFLDTVIDSEAYPEALHYKAQKYLAGENDEKDE